MNKGKMAWFKWFPFKAKAGSKFPRLTLEQEGYYFRLYQRAAMATPASKRGWLYDDGHPLSLQELHLIERVPSETGEKLMQSLIELSLISRNTAGAYGFRDFRKHQSGSPLQVRGSNGTVSAKRVKNESGSESELIPKVPPRVKSTELKNTEVNAPPAPPASSTEAMALRNVIAEYGAVTKQPIKAWHKREWREWLKQYTDGQLCAAIRKCGKVGSKPWDIMDLYQKAQRSGVAAGAAKCKACKAVGVSMIGRLCIPCYNKKGNGE